MKLSGYIMMLLMVGFIFGAANIIVLDFEQAYPEVNPVNRSIGEFAGWDSNFNFEGQIFGNVTFLTNKFIQMTSSESAWFQKITGLVSIPLAIVFVPSVIILGLKNSVSVISNIGGMLSISPFVVTFAITALTVATIFALVAWWRRYKS